MKEIIQTCINVPGINNTTGLPLLIEGPPGGGKTSIISQIAEAEELHLETVILSVREPQDVVGIPVLTVGTKVIMFPCLTAVVRGNNVYIIQP